MFLIGREQEQDALDQSLNSGKPEFVAVFGRRRLGKTYLIRQYFKDEFSFYATGVADGNKREQLMVFHDCLQRYGSQEKSVPRNWFEAFSRLRALLERPEVRRDRASSRVVVFLDEVSWMDTARSDFKPALDYFWNGWASAREDVMLITCGSITSWMISNLIDDHGGFYNRVTRQIRVRPFTLAECAQFYKAAGIVLSTKQLVESYMVFGGVPSYMELVDKRSSLAQNIDQLCFKEEGQLRYELYSLFQSLFKHSERHMAIIQALSTPRGGLTRQELDNTPGICTGKDLTAALRELEQCGFIRRYNDFAKSSNGGHFQIIDPFTLFSLRFLNGEGPESWLLFINTHAHAAWSGLAFELVCLHHVEQIKNALRVGGVQSSQSAWRSAKVDPGVQIDLLIDRKDDVVNLCEMKYNSEPFVIDKAYSQALQRKVRALLEETHTTKAIHITMITLSGLVHNAYWNDIQQELTVDDLLK